MDSDDDWGIEKPLDHNLPQENTQINKLSHIVTVSNMFNGVGKIEACFEDIERYDSQIKKKFGTGFLIGSNKVMTSASNLYFEE